MTVKKKKAVGRKPQYDKWITQKGLAQIKEWSMSGLYQQDIAKNCGVSISSFYEWMDRFPELKEAVKKGAEVAIDLVENALHKRALGYSYIETKKRIVNNKVVEVYTTTKEVPADVTAQIYILKQRRPIKWNIPTETEYRDNDEEKDNYQDVVVGGIKEHLGNDEL